MKFENHFVTSILNTEISDKERLMLDTFMERKLSEFNLVPMLPRNNSSTFFSEGVKGFEITEVEDVLKKYVQAYIKNFLKNIHTMQDKTNF